MWFRPRVLVDVTRVDTSTTMLGAPSSIPFYVTATALAKLGHAEGEVVLTRAAHRHGVIQMIPTLASCSLDEILDAAGPGQTQWLQLYVNRDREVTRAHGAARRGARLPRAVHHGRRAAAGPAREGHARQVHRRRQQRAARPGRRHQPGRRARHLVFIDPGLCWADIAWFRALTRMPIVLKGVQRADDVVRAAEAGVQGVVLSNHGGRSWTLRPRGSRCWPRPCRPCAARGLQHRLEVFVDGGVRRATDILKALCLGARGVGIGRPFLYAMSAYGPAGVDRACACSRTRWR